MMMMMMLCIYNIMQCVSVCLYHFCLFPRSSAGAQCGLQKLDTFSIRSVEHGFVNLITNKAQRSTLGRLWTSAE